MSTLDQLFKSVGLWWERLHLISAGTVQARGVVSQWTQDLVPVGGRAVAAGELVELRVSLGHDHPLAAAPKLRFDVLEFDWLFTGGFDDPVSSLKTADADPPTGDFAVEERVLTEDEYTDDRPSLAAVVDAYRNRHPTDYERGILVVRETDRPDTGGTEIITWWRTQHVEEKEPTLYFVAELPDLRDSSTVSLSVAAPQPGVNLRTHGRVVDTDPPNAADAQPVPGALITLGGRSARTDAAGDYVLDARVPVGTTPVTVARPGLDTRTLRVTVAARADQGFDVAVLDADAADAELVAGAVAADADPGSAFEAAVDLRARVHRLSGAVSWPETRLAAGAALTLAGRYVYALPLAPGALLAQRPRTTRDWDALRARPDVLRSAQPGRPVQAERTAADGRFELSFLDLRAGSRYLLWVEGADPRSATGQMPDAIVRTAAAADMRRMAVQGGFLAPDRHDRRVVDCTYTLLRDDVAAATEVVRVLDVAPAGGAPDLRLARPGRDQPGGIDATPPAGTDQTAVTAATMRADGLALEVLPLIPVFEAPDDQSETARWATRTLHEQLDARYPRGHLLGGARWVLDARRGPTPNWNDAAACTALETTLLTHPALPAASINDPAWGWWRADAVSAADFAGVTEPAGADFGRRTLVDELVPVLVAPVPRLLGLFPGRRLHISPGHGLYSQPPVGAANQIGTGRPDWAGYSAVIENWAGEDENAGGVAIHARRVAAANGVAVTVTREAIDPTRWGVAQNAAQGFDRVDPARDGDWPRLWQQNAYYWIADEWDPAHPGQEIVLGQVVTSAAAQAVNNAGITDRLIVFGQEAAVAVLPVSAFVAIHTNAAGPGARGLLAMYLDIRPTAASPAPGAAGYAETNLVGQSFAQLLVAEIGAAAPLAAGRARTYFEINGNATRELFSTVTHFSNGNGPQAVRAAAPAAGLQPVNFPRPGGQDIPIGYLEVGFHSDPQDAANLAQGWYRFAMGVGIARAAETMIGRNPNAITADDVAGLLRGTFGAIDAVTRLPGGANALAVADVVQAVQAVTGHAPAPASAGLGDVVAAIEAERNLTTREMLAQRIADGLAALAGYGAADPAQADDRARASLGPVLRALGAPARADDTPPAIGDLPRAARPPTRADAAAAIAAGLGLRPGTLAVATAPVNGVAVLGPAAPEAPEAFLARPALDAAVAAVGRLRPLDIYRAGAVRVTDNRGNARPAPYSVTAGEQVYLAIETLGTAWRAGPADVTIIVARAGATVASLACAARTATALRSAAWEVPAPGAPGDQRYDVSLRITHPTAGTETIGPASVTIAVVVP